MLLLQNSFEIATGLPVWIGYLFTFLFGAVVGSFLNVVIHRVPREESIVLPSAACPKCGKAIQGYDNLPILSWLILGGKCRNCKDPISARYPAVELLTGALPISLSTVPVYVPGEPWMLRVAPNWFIRAKPLQRPTNCATAASSTSARSLA